MQQGSFSETARALFDEIADAVMRGEEPPRQFLYRDGQAQFGIVVAPCEGPEADSVMVPMLRLQFRRLKVWEPTCRHT